MMWLVLLYAAGVMNLVTFAAFGLDKWMAVRGARRISEATLVGLSWATGFVGGWAAMQVFGHKTRKRSFQLKMLVATLANLAWPLLYAYWRWR